MIKRLLLITTIIILTTSCGIFGGKVKLDSTYYNEGKYIEVKSDFFNDNSHKNYVLFVYNSFCALKIPCDTIFKQYMEKYKIDFLSMNIDEFKKTKYFEKVKFSPTVIVVKNKKIVAYLRSDSDDDVDKYQDVSEFETWINKYIETNK